MNNIPVSGHRAKTSRITAGRFQILWSSFGLVLVAIVLQLTQIRLAPPPGDLKLEALLSLPQHAGQERRVYLFPFQLAALTVQLVRTPERELCPASPGACLVRLSRSSQDEFCFEPLPVPSMSVIAAVVQEMSVAGRGRHFEQMAQPVNARNGQQATVNDAHLQNLLGRELLPPISPFEGAWPSNNFGWRQDPFTGTRAIHEGIDYMAPEGTTIRALADGVVVYSENHYQYGKMIEIYHGNNIVTRYAHASRLLVKVGQTVWRGEKIAEVGSTGRATGSHLHFEVRYKGIAQNPMRFLQNAAS